ncbi:mitochondrial ribosomal protein L31-domain-containing protein [Aspergillus foveolatus]|uniref:mitochondrial ribosomal protein L31-domain-containing protein n=1 Tax=Aspergillus foveolatus TaxID=210207 RepID=UPI003CCDF5C0
MMFKPSSPLFSGLLWKIPWRISQPQKARQRKRLRAVDKVVDTVSAALARNGQTTKAVERWYKEMPREEEMLPRDKYTIFDKKEKTYRKGIHKLPKWTRVSQRVNPPGF